MHIGLIGPEELLAKNIGIFEALGHQAAALTEPAQLAVIDGLMITAWRSEDLRRLKRLRRAIKEQKRLGIMGAALGAYALGQNGYLALMDHRTYFREEEQPRTAILTVPSWENHRMAVVFQPEIRFDHIAPNLGILCRLREQGPIVLRQGNYLAVSFAPEEMKDRAIYCYFLDMLGRAKR